MVKKNHYIQQQFYQNLHVFVHKIVLEITVEWIIVILIQR